MAERRVGLQPVLQPVVAPQWLCLCWIVWVSCVVSVGGGQCLWVPEVCVKPG